MTSNPSDARPTSRASVDACTLPGCGKPVRRRGLCSAHYRLQECEHPDCSRRLPEPGLCPTHVRAARLEDATWLLDLGVHPTEVVRRLGFSSVDNLDHFLRRNSTPHPLVTREVWHEQKAAS